MRGCTNQRYYIQAPDGTLLLPPGNVIPKLKKDGENIPPKTKEDKVWRWTYETYLLKKDLLIFKKTKISPLIDQNGNQAKYNIYTKSYLKEIKEIGTLPRNLWTDFINRKGADLLKKMNIPFDFSKPVELIEYILKIINTEENDYILDLNLINQEKAATVIDGITYHKTENKYDNSIFTINNVRGELGENAIDVKKHIYDFLITDSKNETNFAKKLESGEVTVYAKLPNGFKIPTPVGNYNPDWAIVFDNNSFKYIYFIAETKGSMNSMELREVEKAKIECARKHFQCLCSNTVKYDVVDSYESLINILAQ